jgi:small subunit ribosomal protein S2
MRTITLEELLEAGCHFGHQVTRQNPKSRDFVFEARDNIHIIDLEKTKEGLEKGAAFIKEIAQKPESTLLLLGTKRQAAIVVKEELERARNEGMTSSVYAVTARWIGGTLTNAVEVLKNYKKLKDLTQRLQNDFEKMKYTKKEISLWEKERQKLTIYYGGTQDMVKAPDVIFVIDTHTENLAVREANAMSVPTVGIVDTNADPYVIDHPIPANDDALGSIKLITAYIIDAWIEGKKKGIAKNAKEEEAVTDDAEIVKETKKEEKAPAKEAKKPAKKTIKKEEAK